MKKIVVFFILALMLLAPLAYAGPAEEGEDGIIVYSLKASNGFQALPFAIVLDKAVWEPGEIINSIIGSDVPCNTESVFLRIVDDGGSRLYYKDVSSLFSSCSTSYVEYTFAAPQTVGDYRILVDFRDGSNQVIYTDQTIFKVATEEVSCPENYCTGWDDVQDWEHGTLQTKTCYFYDGSSCSQTQEKFDRITCDSGFVLEGSDKCVLESGEPLCGDRVVQEGEACDFGDDNGVCPSSCNSFCQLSQCEEIPDVAPPGADNPGNDKQDSEEVTTAFLSILLILLSVGLIIGGVWYIFFKK